MNNFKYITEFKNKFLLSILLILILSIIYLLVSNISRGFDITDDSYYILNAQYYHYNEIYPVIRRDGFYTGIIYSLVNGNLAYLRLSGILILVTFSTWLAFETVRYFSAKIDSIINKWLFSIPIVASSLAYYRYWLITPSYNWLALLSAILVLIAVLRIVNRRDTNYDKIFTFDYVLLAFSLNLAFIAKPTTALILAVIVLMFTLLERKHINLLKAYSSIFILTLVIVLAHIVWSYGDVGQYYDRLIESLQRMSTIDPRYTLNDRITATIKEFKDFFFEKYYFHTINKWYILFVAVLLLSVSASKLHKNIGLLLLYILFMGYVYLLFQEGHIIEFKMIWFRLTELMVLSWGIVFISLVYMNKVKILFSQTIFFLLVAFIFSFASIAYALGTNGTMIYAMSSSIIFIVLGIIVANTLIDNIFSTNVFLPSSGIVISIFVLYVLLGAYNHPYRLITNITGQDQKVDLLGGLYVDDITKKYIESLQKIKQDNTIKNQTITLLDMTGGSPGANVILDAEFFGEPWLAGAYPGSNKSLKVILKTYQGTEKLKHAWILTAPKGTRKLALEILEDLDLNFPDDYVKIGTIKTAHRHETQVVWKPKVSLHTK